MNKIIINGTAYELPTDNKNLSSVLNHFSMVKSGKKDHIRLNNIESGETEILHTALIQVCEFEKIFNTLEKDFNNFDN